MRVIECNFCGEPLVAATDEELIRRLKAHVEEEHSASAYDDAQARELILSEAYEASDN